MRIYAGTPYRMGPHIERARRGLAALDIRYDGLDSLPDVTGELIRRNDLDGAEATLYL
ncbi:MAG: D-amino acid aminotransferase, partial [Gemmatimonadetes bacterium]|nr:D-amino acid aminotransferase [Gemmatimonadota bacterium]NIQ54297.1 D-amino acid aminotransferase [Gemmatimonadota bacterium]NIU74507.1 D-amino acid aminotransferase [Gammaproteobacteria bacterium]NIX44460.1 D-amino acid aminotransferase [Gemmatimonadota bacterium]